MDIDQLTIREERAQSGKVKVYWLVFGHIAIKQ
jgi:hypothetical protein